MPELDGLGVLSIIKSTPELSYLPIIVVSGAELFEKTVECIQIGATGLTWIAMLSAVATPA
jgi:CheY-like chemotaxis protein